MLLLLFLLLLLLFAFCLRARVCVCVWLLHILTVRQSARIYANCAPIAEIALAIQNSHVAYVSLYIVILSSLSPSFTLARSLVSSVYVCVRRVH